VYELGKNTGVVWGNQKFAPGLFDSPKFPGHTYSLRIDFVRRLLSSWYKNGNSHSRFYHLRGFQLQEKILRSTKLLR
jgi:hypothetical protein